MGALYLSLGLYLHSTFYEKPSGDESRVSLTIAVPSGIKTVDIYRKKIRQFEKENPDISVKLMEISGEFYQKVLVMIAGNIAPDLMWMGQSFSEFADRGVFLDITDRIEKADIDLKDHRPNILKLYQRDGRYYSIPFGIDASFLMYNRKMFRESGIPFPTDDWDFSAFVKAAKALTKRDESNRISCYGFKGGLGLEVFGASIFDPVTGKVTCNTPEMINYFQTNLDLEYKYNISPTAEEQEGQNLDSLAYFKQERAAMMIFNTMRWNRAFEMLKDMDWGITLCPKVKQHGQWASSQAMCIYRDTKEPDAAWRLFKSFQDTDFQLAMSCRMIPARQSLLPEMLSDKKEDNPVNYKVISKVVDVLFPTPRVPHLQELMAVFQRFGGKIFARQISPAEGMAECEIEMNRRIEKFKLNEKKGGE